MTVPPMRRLLGYMLGLVVLATLPLVLSATLATQIISFAIFALGYNFLLGYSGEMSFGHAAYFGIGAYGTVLATIHISEQIYVAILFGVAVATLLGLIIGYLSLFQRGIYFAMVTLAFSMMVYYFVFQMNDITGGDNGIILPLKATAAGPLQVLENSFDLYVLAVLFLIVCYFLVRRLIRSPLGNTLEAIRESEERATHMGYNTDRFLLIAFVVSAAFSGLAGALYALAFDFITPQILYWTASGEVILITIIGGVGTMTGPVVGAIIYVLFIEHISDLTEHWQILLGLFFVLVVSFLPEGVIGRYQKIRGESSQFNASDLINRLLR